MKMEKIARGISKTLFYIVLFFSIFVFASVIYLRSVTPQSVKLGKETSLTEDSPLPVRAIYRTAEDTGNRSVNLKMFGIIPFSDVSIQTERTRVMLLGTPFGMKLYTNGLLVVDMTQIITSSGEECPAQKAGLKTGDYILSVNGTKVKTNEQLVKIIEQSGGRAQSLEVLRGTKRFTVFVTGVLSSETGTYKIGVWVRDSSAGIGTLTFYSPDANMLCGLGHGICDEDTDTLLKLSSGEIVSAKILSAEKGQNGSPGQLKGEFTQNALGNVERNCSCGIYSSPSRSMAIDALTDIADKNKVKNGKAQILCTVQGDTPQYYDCIVSIKKGNYDSKTKNMVVTVTDERLITVTGGIVQGMSGSPVIQNGKLIGALTHVLIDDPQKGYAIFAENMLLEAEQAADSVKKKEAS